MGWCDVTPPRAGYLVDAAGAGSQLLRVQRAHNSAISGVACFGDAATDPLESPRSARVASASKADTLRAWEGRLLEQRVERVLAALPPPAAAGLELDVCVSTWNVNAKDHSRDGAEPLNRWVMEQRRDIESGWAAVHESIAATAKGGGGGRTGAARREREKRSELIRPFELAPAGAECPFGPVPARSPAQSSLLSA